jgi:hypothetical protein
MLLPALLKALRKFDQWFVYIALAASLGMNVYLATGHFGRDAGALPDSLVGSKLPPLSVVTLGGKTIQLDWRSDRRATLIYIFSPRCAWCARNLENIRTLSTSRGSQYRFVGISLLGSGLSEYVSRQDVRFETYSGPRRADGRKFGSVTPETLIVDPDGRVRHDWQGAYTQEVQKEIESVMGVKLPGLTPMPPPASTSAPPSDSGGSD